MNPFNLDIEAILHKSFENRLLSLEAIKNAQSGHPGGSLSIADIMSVLFFSVMNYSLSDFNSIDKDHFVLSNGHTVASYYAALSQIGLIQKNELLNTFRKIDSRLQGHPHNISLPFVEASTGPLGQGVGVGIGIALGLIMRNIKNRYVYILSSDGEHQEGAIWETIQFASAKRLDNIILVIDNNNIEIDGFVDDIVPVAPLKKKYESFGWDAFEANGNNIDDLIYTFDLVKKSALLHNGRPKVVIAHTVLGYGVDFMENKYIWHGKQLSDVDFDLAKKSLEEYEKSTLNTK